MRRSPTWWWRSNRPSPSCRGISTSAACTPSWTGCERWAWSSSRSRRHSLVRAVGQAAQLDELEAERQDAVERAVQARLVEFADQGGVRVVGFDPEVAECLPADLTQTTGDDDPIAVRMHVPSACT